MDCTVEGSLFKESDAAISLEEFGDLYPAIPHGDDFINNVSAAEKNTESPLLIQVCKPHKIR